MRKYITKAESLDSLKVSNKSLIVSLTTNCTEKQLRQSVTLKEHNHVFAHAPDFDFWTGCREFKDARSDVEP